MSYRNIKSYISVLCIYVIMWYGLDYYKLDEFEGYSKFEAIAGIIYIVACELYKRKDMV